MSEVIEFANHYENAMKKIDQELKEFKGDNYGKEVSKEVAQTVKKFAEQNVIFARAVINTKRTLSDVVYESMKEWAESKAKHVSDIDVYRAVVRNYFPNSEINFKMVLELGDEPTLEDLNRETIRPKKQTSIKKESKPVEPPRELTELEKIEQRARLAQEKAERERIAQENKIKEQIAKEKKRNEEMGQLFLFDL